MHRYLTGRSHRIKINNFYNLWKLIKHEVPHSLSFSPTLFIVFLCDMFFMIDTTDIASYANNNNPYRLAKNQSDLKSKLQKASVKLPNVSMKMA